MAKLANVEAQAGYEVKRGGAVKVMPGPRRFLGVGQREKVFRFCISTIFLVYVLAGKTPDKG